MTEKHDYLIGQQICELSEPAFKTVQLIFSKEWFCDRRLNKHKCCFEISELPEVFGKTIDPIRQGKAIYAELKKIKIGEDKFFTDWFQSPEIVTVTINNCYINMLKTIKDHISKHRKENSNV